MERCAFPKRSSLRLAQSAALAITSGERVSLNADTGGENLPPPDVSISLTPPPPVPPAPPFATMSSAALLISTSRLGLISASRSSDTLSSSSTPSLCASSRRSCICSRSLADKSRLPSALRPIPAALVLASAAAFFASTIPSASTKQTPISSQFFSENRLHSLHVFQTLRSLARCSSLICSKTTGIHALASVSMTGMNLPLTFLRSESMTYTRDSLRSTGACLEISGVRIHLYRADACAVDDAKSSATIDRLLIFTLS
mmetsp:Transcript_19876/g.42831  ORF Transcript_19876/g.42831 Transcript_19876/m.42831 type:complete len:258 (+) Transcript_19876:1025-1798(+)